MRNSRAPVLVINGVADVIPQRFSESWAANYPNALLPAFTIRIVDVQWLETLNAGARPHTRQLKRDRSEFRMPALFLVAFRVVSVFRGYALFGNLRAQIVAKKAEPRTTRTTSLKTVSLSRRSSTAPRICSLKFSEFFDKKRFVHCFCFWLCLKRGFRSSVKPSSGPRLSSLRTFSEAVFLTTPLLMM